MGFTEVKTDRVQSTSRVIKSSKTMKMVQFAYEAGNWRRRVKNNVPH
jgi:hypothetical protein